MAHITGFMPTLPLAHACCRPTPVPTSDGRFVKDVLLRPHTPILVRQHATGCAVAQHPSPNGSACNSRHRHLLLQSVGTLCGWMFGCGGQPPALGFAEDGIHCWGISNKRSTRRAVELLPMY
ncbi:hypothetical protein HaLaN_21806 [Haematococcus lacustris]|uniref:Uncharacterized protein n=1 Tax=Haematococcus lacustris TaxID=44745 RepID=A0A6A0A348_HAELA|nr:hypothetical protein HaLaN_21806 [Haematococcus lacustris]